MRDVGPWLVPEGDDPVPIEQELRFLDHMAALHAHFWGWQDTYDLQPPTHRYLYFSAVNLGVETARAEVEPVPRIATDGWARFAKESPLAAEILALRAEPWPLVDALAAMPQTFLHGDWKMGNLGSHPDGRTILIDWATSGRGTPASELAWYLAHQRGPPARTARRRPSTAYAASLRGHGVATDGWWDASVDLALLGGLVQFGWEKVLGSREELAWWEDRRTRRPGPFVTQPGATEASDGYSAAAWSGGPGPVYDRLADAVVGAAPFSLAGALVLDLGAGTGAASRAVLARRGRVVALDLSADMLEFDRQERPPAAVADASRLPSRRRQRRRCRRRLLAHPRRAAARRFYGSGPRRHGQVAA